MALNTDTLGLSATVTAEGISAPDYQTLLAALTDYFRQIYGPDAYLEPDSKDGQMVALMALAIHDANNMAIRVYNSFSPATAMSDALTRNVKINGIQRMMATQSTVDLVLTGIAGTTMTNALVEDNNGSQWNLPASVTIGTDGTTTVTATAARPGAVAAVVGSITQINTPTRGWTSVFNPVAATVGVPAESDARLRIRQVQSVALPSVSSFDGLNGAIANISGVSRHKLYENDTGHTDASGIPAHSVSAIVEGGNAETIARVLLGNKGQGVGTYGTSSLKVADRYGNPHIINFSRPVSVPVFVTIALKVFPGYTNQMGEQIKQAIASYISSLDIGASVLLSRVYSPANLGVVSGGNARYYDIHSLLIGTVANALSAENIVIAYDHSAICSADNIIITVVP